MWNVIFYQEEVKFSLIPTVPVKTCQFNMPRGHTEKCFWKLLLKRPILIWWNDRSVFYLYSIPQTSAWPWHTSCSPGAVPCLRRVASANHSTFKALHLIERLMWVNQTGTFQTSNQTICCYIRFYPLQISVMCIITKLYVLWKRKIERWTLTHTSAWQAKCCKCAPMRCVYIFAPECRQVLPCEVCRACPLRRVLLNSRQDVNTDWIWRAPPRVKVSLRRGLDVRLVVR